MAIDKVQEFALAFSHRDEDRVLSLLFKANAVHLTSYTSSEEELSVSDNEVSCDVCKPEREQALSDVKDEIERVKNCLAFFNEVEPVTRGLVQSFFPDEVYVTLDDLKNTARMADNQKYLPFLHAILETQKELAEQQKELSSLSEREVRLAEWANLPIDFGEISHWGRVSVIVGTIPPFGFQRLLAQVEQERLPAAIQSVFESKTGRGIVVACMLHDVDVVQNALSASGFVEEDFSDVHATVSAAIHDIVEQERDVHARIRSLETDTAAFLKRRKELVVYREYLLNEEKRLNAADDMTRSEHCSVVTGYVRADDVSSFERLLSAAGGVIYAIDDPSGDDSVTPVSITNNRWVKPFELLINMFGYPAYSSFDPTIYLAIPFLIFFGLCLGDVLYGAFQIAFCFYFIHKYRNSTGVRNFMMVFVYGGVASMIVGALTGSWGGDLISATYLGKNNPVARLVSAMTVINPLQEAFKFLIIVWIVGAVNQLYGVCLAILKAARRHDYAAVLFDCVGWLLFLPALSALLFIGTKWGATFRVAYLVALFVGLALLVIGGARQGHGGGKVLSAIVNLYGIQSSYGVGSFLGDVLSYSRLMALALTTSLLGAAFNMIAALIKMPIVGILLSTLVLLFGHLLNYFMSAMSAFIHPARLILLEFFGRFYESGAPRFHRFGFSSEVVKVVDKSVISET